MQQPQFSLPFGCRLLAVVIAAEFLAVSTSQAGIYQDYVGSLSPNFYFELNETDSSGGVLDTVSGTALGSYNIIDEQFIEIGADGPDLLIEGGAWTTNDVWTEVGADVPIVGLGPDNKAFAANDDGHIDIGLNTNYGANAITVSAFAKSGGNPQGGERIFTNNLSDALQSFQIVVGNDGIVVSVDPANPCSAGSGSCGHKSLFLPGEGEEGFGNAGADRGMSNMPGNNWWHIVASTEGTTVQERVDNIRLWLNGVDRTADFKPGTTNWGVDTDQAKIAGRRATPDDSTTYSGVVDEVSIWLDRVLTDDEALNLYNAAIGIAPGGDGDFDNDGDTDGADLVEWQRQVPTLTAGDLGDWGANFGSGTVPAVAGVPEPATLIQLTLMAAGAAVLRRRRA